MNEKPGVVLYFDVLPALKFLSNEQMGKLFKAILEYGESERTPDFADDPLLGMAWCFVGPRIDRDGESYGEKKEQRKYAVYCREAKKCNVTPMVFDEWRRSTDKDRKNSLSPDNRNPSEDNGSASSPEKGASK